MVPSLHTLTRVCVCVCVCARVCVCVYIYIYICNSHSLTRLSVISHRQKSCMLVPGIRKIPYLHTYIDLLLYVIRGKQALSRSGYGTLHT